MYKLNDKVIFDVDFMVMPVIGRIVSISGVHCRCLLVIPMKGRTHYNTRIDQLSPSEDLQKEWDEERKEKDIDKLQLKKSKTINQLVEDIKNAKKIHV